MAEFGSWSFKDASAIVGIEEVAGWSDADDALVIEPAIARFTKIVGAKGDVTRSQSNDNSVKITLKLLQTSSTNAVLQALETVDRETGVGVFPFIYNTPSGESYFISNAWIAEQPTYTRGRNQNDMTWILEGDIGVPLLT